MDPRITGRIQLLATIFEFYIFLSYENLAVRASSSQFSGKTSKTARCGDNLETYALRDIMMNRYLRAAASSIPEDVKIRNLTQSYMADFVDSNGVTDLSEQDVSFVTKNAIRVYRLLRRYNYVKELTANSDPHTARKYLPPQRDLEDAIDAILRIHHVYGLRSSDLAAGNIRGKITGSKLNAFHCYEIGIFARSKGKFSLAVEWLSTALNNTKLDGSMEHSTIKDALAETIKMHELAFLSRDTKWDYHFFMTPDASQPDTVKIITGRSLIYKGQAGKRGDYSVTPNYWGLCSGDKFEIQKTIPRLFCWLERVAHPVFTIGPLKMEFLFRNPDIVQIYNVLNNEETAKLIFEANRMKPSRITDLYDQGGSGVLEDEGVRSSCQGLVKEKPHHVVNAKLAKRIELITGLTLRPLGSCEYTQVVSYAVGGHYTPHLDSLQKEYIYGEPGDRIATFMVYLVDAEEGGNTVFTDVLVTSQPVKGSALFWFNVNPDGTPDRATVHGACPVVTGKKWVATKWIRFYDQFLRRKCPVNPKERFQIAVNGKSKQSWSLPRKS